MRGFAVFATFAILGAPTAAAAEAVLWMHNSEENELFLSAKKVDPLGAQASMYTNFLSWLGSDRVYTPTGILHKEMDIPLRPGEPMQAVITVGDRGGWVATWGTFDVWVDILLDGESIGSGDPQTVTFEPGTSYWTTLTWDIMPSVAVIPAGSTLTFDFRSFGQASGYEIRTQHDDPMQRSWLGLPADLPDPVQIEQVNAFQNLEGPAATYKVNQVTSGTKQFNWTMSKTTGDFFYEVNGTGLIALRIVDGAGQEVYDDEVTMNIGGPAVKFDVANASTGKWYAQVNMTEFQGTLSFWYENTARELVVEKSGNADPNAGTEEEAPSEDSAIGPLLAVAAVVAVALLRRRDG